MAKEIQRTPEEKKYRSEVAQTLETLRKSGSKDLARTFLEREKNKDKYKDSQRLNVEVKNQCRGLTDDKLKKVLRFIDDLKREEPKPYEMQEEPKPEKKEHIGNKMICPVCGRMDHEPGARFCHGCGNKFSIKESNQEKEYEEQKKESKNKRRRNRSRKNRKNRN